jgi:hypothetical protein
MVIKIFPEDIVKRGLWDNYVYYIVNSEKEAEKILKENKEFIISERDALVIGLLKVIETDNLIHKFNTYIIEILTNKSIKEEDLLLIKKKTLDSTVEKFLDKFPNYWDSKEWIKPLKELNEYIDSFKNDIENMKTHIIDDKNITHEFYNSSAIKKILKFKY